MYEPHEARPRSCLLNPSTPHIHHTTSLHPTHRIVVVFTATVLARVLECPRLDRVGFISNKAQLRVNTAQLQVNKAQLQVKKS